MYVIDYKPNYSKIFLPHSPRTSCISVKEIGHGYQVPGFDTGVLTRDAAAIHFLFSGSATYNGVKITAPCLFIMFPHESSRYVVNSESETFEVYWFELIGTHLLQFISDFGFCKERNVIPCSFISMFTDILTSLTNPEVYEEEDDGFYMLSGLFKLMSIYSRECQKSQTAYRSPYTNKILSYIHSNYSTQISEELLANNVHLSTNYMHKIFSRDMNMPPIDYLNNYRVKCSKRMLAETNYSISRIAEAVGFSSGNYFCRVFKKYNNNISPTEYRANKLRVDQEKGNT